MAKRDVRGEVLAAVYAVCADVGLENLTTKRISEAANASEAIEETEKLVREHDGDRVREELSEQLDKINGIEYLPGQADGYYETKIEELNAAAVEAETEIRHAQSQQRTENQIKEDADNREESGQYNDAQLAEIESILADATVQIDAVTSGEGADARLEIILEETLERLENVSMSSVVAGDVKPDGSSPSGGSADYGEGHDGSQIWGIVTNDAGLPGGIQLVIEKTDNDVMSAIESAAQSDGLVAAEGSDLSKDDLPALVADKEVKTALDIYLLKNNVRVEQFEGYYVVKILLPQDMRAMSGLQVVYVGDDGRVEVFETKIEGNYLVFTTAHFSEFYILGDTELNLWWLIITLSVIFVLELVVIALLAARRNKKDDGENGENDGTKQGEPQTAQGGAVKMNAFIPAPLMAVNLIPNGAIPAIIVLAVLVAVAAAVIVALLIKGKRRERAAEEETFPAEAAEPAPVQPAPAGLGAAAVGAIVGGAAVPLAVGDWYTRVIYDRSFEARLIQSDERTKNYYSELKNELMSYKKVTARMSWKHEAFRRGRPTVAKFVFRGKTLCLCLALDPKAYDGSKYIVDDMSDVARFAGTPLLYRIKNDRRLRYAKELIAVLLAEAERVNAAPVNYADTPYEETQPLVERGLIRIVGTERVRYDGNKTAAYADEEEDIAEEVALSEDTGDRRASVSASEADALMADEAAEAQIEEGVRYADKTKTGIINVDTLGKMFAEGEKVTLEEIKKRVPFIHKKTTYIKVLARGELNKALVIEADDYSVEAVKMILLTGGKVIRTRRRK